MQTKILDKPREKRPIESGPIDLVLDALNDLMKRINYHGGKDKLNNMLEKYDYFCYHSERGRACTYAMKAKSLFLQGDYPDVKKALEKVLLAIRNVPGEENFGK